MKIVVFSVSKEVHKIRARRFIHGLRHHGYDATLNTPGVCDLAVFWGILNFQHIISLQERSKKDYLVMEAAYIREENRWNSLGYNGLNGRANFLNKNSPPDRWNKYFPDHLKPWKKSGKYILITGQVTGDASLRPVNGKVNYQQIVSELKQYTDRPIHYRRHPHKKRPTAGCPKGAINSTGTLEEALAGAHCVVTFNSNTSIDAVLSGTPCIALDKGAMAWDVCGHSLKDVNNPPKSDREQWAYNLAYTQWLREEIEDGTAWGHLKKKYE